MDILLVQIVIFEFRSAWLDCNIGAVTLADFSWVLHSFRLFGFIRFVPFNFPPVSFLCACLSARAPLPGCLAACHKLSIEHMVFACFFLCRELKLLTVKIARAPAKTI